MAKKQRRNKEGIDLSDIPEADEAWFKRAKLKMPRAKIERTDDYDMVLTTLCWQRRDGTGGWSKGAVTPMTKEAADRLIAWLNREFPDFEHWAETD